MSDYPVHEQKEFDSVFDAMFYASKKQLESENNMIWEVHIKRMKNTKVSLNLIYMHYEKTN